VAHAGEELRLALARLRQLPVLVLDFIEQAHVLDRDHGLVGEGREELVAARSRQTGDEIVPNRVPCRRKHDRDD